jgi:hypothetical protein
MRLVLTFTDSRAAKLERGDDDISVMMDSSAMQRNQISRAKPPPLLQHDYPLVKYWEKRVWKGVAGSKKDTSEVQTKNGSRGGTRSSKGENVMMLYIEDADGLPIDGNIAGGMREFARSIWRSLYERGIAPETWGQATKEVREEYCQEMESEYPVLRLCNNHWKANALATAIYSQWRRIYDRKSRACQDDNNNEDDSSDSNNSDDDTGDGTNGPPRKKARATTVLDDDIDFTLPEPEINRGMFFITNPTDANNATDPPRSNSDARRVEDSGSSSRCGAALKDPLYAISPYCRVSNARGCQLKRLPPTHVAIRSTRNRSRCHSTGSNQHQSTRHYPYY